MSLWRTGQGPDDSRKEKYPITFYAMRELRLIMLLLISGGYLFTGEPEEWQLVFVVGSMLLFACTHLLHFSSRTTRYYLWWSGIDFVISVLFGIVFPTSSIYQINFGIIGVTLLIFTDHRKSLTAAAVLLAVAWAALWRFNYLHTGRLNLLNVLTNFGFVLNSIFVGALIRYLMQARLKIAEQYEALDESHRALQDAHDQLHNYANQVEQLTETKERNRIAREIHDTVGHTMTALLVQLQATRMLQEHDPVKSKETLLRCEDLARSALQEVRLSVRTLRDEESAKPTIIESVRTLLSDFSNMTGVLTSLHLEGNPSCVTASLQPIIYRIIQESLTNAKRHGNADKAKVTIRCSHRQIELEIHDDGQGTAEVTPGFGLINMRERVQEQGGTVRFASEREGGFLVSAIFPLQQQIWSYGG